MSQGKKATAGRGRDRECGQSVVLVLGLLLGLLAAAALVVDMGKIYVSYQQLNTVTKAAALAGGAAIPLGAATNAAYLYSGWSKAPVTGTILNVNPNLKITNVTINTTCVAPSSYPNVGLPPCSIYSASQGSINVIQVQETAFVTPIFAGIFGYPGTTLTATASASAKGGGAPPYHIVVVLDSTASMGQGTDTGCISNQTSKSLSPEQCAQEGVQTLLSELDPCATTATSGCGTATNGLYPNSVDEVALMTFPGLCSATLSGSNCPTATTFTTTPSPYASNDYSCPTSDPPITSYNNNPAYLILPFQSDYRTSDSASLNLGTSGSNLLKAAGGVTNGSCTGITTPGGEGTFYAGAIYAAQDYLEANHASSVQDILILVSDGNATSCGYVPSGYPGAGTMASGCSKDQMGGNVPTNGLPLFTITNECQQAVTAASAVKSYKEPDGTYTQIYSVSYGSETSGCAYDQAPYGNSGLTPCMTMAQIATIPSGVTAGVTVNPFFFSVPNSTTKGGTICTGAEPVTQLSQVFTTIAGNLTSSRLIPNSIY